jgi:exosortase
VLETKETATEKTKSSIGAAGRTAIVATVALGAALGWSFRSSFFYLAQFWEKDSNYSHGWMIVPFALVILWQRREVLETLTPRTNIWGFVTLAALLAFRAYLYEQNEQWIEAALIPPVVAALVLAVAGWQVLRWALPAVIYLYFMVPLPPRFNDLLASPLQTVATLGAVQVLKVLRLPVLSEGNIIYIGTQHVEVAEACRGLSMLLSFAALITLMVILVRRPIWERVLLVLSIIPIALFCNIIRISVTAVAYWYKNQEVHTVHDWAGYAMMVLALGLVLLELKVMSWVIVEERDRGPALLRAAYGPNPGTR